MRWMGYARYQAFSPSENMEYRILSRIREAFPLISMWHRA